MLSNRVLALFAVLACLSGMAGTADAAEVDCDSVYCFRSADFGPDQIVGICITDLPESNVGTIMLGSRVLQPGDILTSEQAAQMTFCPLVTEQDCAAQIGYLPVYEDHVAASATMTIAIRGKEDKAPVAEDSAVETYKNLPVTAQLKVSDPEGQAMTYTVTRQPKRGNVSVNADGSFTYTPKKNKVGIDSFVYTATDPAGKVSREATVTITLLKPTEAAQYTDTIGRECRFAAEWMKHTGIFVGETVAENPCFSPEKAVTRGEFVTMLVKALEIPAEEEARFTGYTDEIPQWLRPYLAAAVRSGLTAGLPEQETFGGDTAITGAEAAVMLQNALDLTVETSAEESADPDWAQTALTAMRRSGISLDAGEVLTRSDAAMALYRAVQIRTERDMDTFALKR